MFANLTGWHMVAILFIIVLLFGAPKLPGLAKSLGQSMRILKKEVGSEDDAVSTAGMNLDEPSRSNRDPDADPEKP